MSRSPRWRSTRTPASSAAASRPMPRSAPISAISASSSRPWPAASMLNGLYQTPAIYVNVKGVMTNTVPTDAYRGAGRPEAAYLLERFVDHIARETGLTPDEIRARNFIKPSQIPFKTALGDSYDSGDFETVMRKGMEKADWKGFPARRAQSAARGKWRGIGMATYVEKCSGGNPETVKAQFNDDVDDHALHRQPDQRPGPRDGAEPDRLGAARHRCRAASGSCRATATWCPRASPAAAAPSPINGAATVGVADKIIAKGKQVAASVLEASADRHRLRGRHLPDRRHRPHDQPVRGGQGGQGSQACAEGRHAERASTTSSPARPRPTPSPTAATSASSRSIPTPARSRS